MSRLVLMRVINISILLVALDSLLCIALWLAGGDSLYLEDSVKEFSLTHSTFDLVVIAAIRGVVLFGCFFFIERHNILLAPVKNGERSSSTDRITLLCQLSVIIVFSVVSLVYSIVKGGFIIQSIETGTWTDVSKETEMHITYKILCIAGLVFPLLESVLGFVCLWLVRTRLRIQKLRLLVNLEGGDIVSAPQRKADLKRIILTAKPVS